MSLQTSILLNYLKAMLRYLKNTSWKPLIKKLGYLVLR